MRLLQLTTIENDSTAQITVAERDRFKALWMPEGAYVSLTKELNEKLSKEKVTEILPQIVVLGVVDASEITIEKSALPFAVNLVANTKGFPILHYDASLPEVNSNIVAVSIFLKPEEVVEKIFVHNDVKLRFYRVMDEKPNFASLLLQLEERDNSTPQFTVVISKDGVQTMAYEIYNDKIVPSKRTFALRKEGQQLRLRVDYLVPKATPKPTKKFSARTGLEVTSELRSAVKAPTNSVGNKHVSAHVQGVFRPIGMGVKDGKLETPHIDALLEKFQKDANDRASVSTNKHGRDKYKNKR